jgi:hypothetical protein
VAWVGHGDATQRLHSLGHQVDQRELLGGVLVQQQVELVEGVAAHQPVVLLVEVVEDDRVGQRLVERLAARRTCLVIQCDRQVPDGVEGLDLHALLVQERLAGALAPVGAALRLERVPGLSLLLPLRHRWPPWLLGPFGSPVSWPSICREPRR